MLENLNIDACGKILHSNHENFKVIKSICCNDGNWSVVHNGRAKENNIEVILTL